MCYFINFRLNYLEVILKTKCTRRVIAVISVKGTVGINGTVQDVVWIFVEELFHFFHIPCEGPNTFYFVVNTM